MGFYEEISKYYDYIFPVSEETTDFIDRIAGKAPKSILDVACGTGGYSLELEKRGHNMTAIDLDKAMIMLKDAGFKYIKAYGGFDFKEFDKENTFLMIIEAS